MDLGLAGKAALVAGGSRGIGRSIALALAREGARVCVAARGQADLDALLPALTAAGGGPHAIVAGDVASAAGAQAALDATRAAFGDLEIVIGNVGKSFARTADQMDEADLAQSLEVNLWSAARIAQRAAPVLAARGGGSITLTSSVFGREAGGAPGYNIGKAAVIAMAKALARDYAKANIRVNSVAPGSIRFPGSGWDRRVLADPEGMAAFVARELPFGRFGTPDEVADVVAFIASPRAGWVTGSCVVVDGGQGRAL